MASGSGGQQFPPPGPPGGQAPQFAPPQFAPPLGPGGNGGPMYVPPGMGPQAQTGMPPGFDPISMMLNRMSMLEAQMMAVQADNASLRSRNDARGPVDTRLIGRPDVFSGKDEDGELRACA